ncbi:aminodeoxychorismate synthase component I [soil metagenome]
MLDAAHELAGAGSWCIGYVRYEAAAAFDTAFELYPPDGPLAWFAVYDEALPWPEGTPQVAAGYAPMAWTSSLGRTAFDSRIDRIHEAIGDGEVYQINLTARVESAFDGDPRSLFDALHSAQPRSYAAFIDTGAEQLLSVSPELFLQWRDGELSSRPMKGTAPRGATSEQDEANAAALVASVKERAENLMIVDLIRNDMSRIAEPHSVKVPRLFHTQAWPTVWQMTSDVVCRTKAGTRLSDVFAAMFPCGSITGAPKVRAMHWIKQLEDGPRGVFYGAVGVLRPGGEATFSVAIRTVTVDVDGGGLPSTTSPPAERQIAIATPRRASCGIGSGITSDATSAGEWVEWRNKRDFLERHAQRFELLETLLLEEDGNYPDIEAHVARMAGAAAHFGFGWSEAKARDELQSVAQRNAGKLSRVRLLCARDSVVTATATPMTLPAPDATPLLVKLASQAFDEAGSEFVRFKTTRRAHYDAFAAIEKGVFDTLLWNVRGELTEFTFGNVAILLDGTWVTPPLHCGLLAGVGRALWLARGKLTERVIRVDELGNAQGIAFINALRGWMPVTLAEPPPVS